MPATTVSQKALNPVPLHNTQVGALPPTSPTPAPTSFSSESMNSVGGSPEIIPKLPVSKECQCTFVKSFRTDLRGMCLESRKLKPRKPAVAGSCPVAGWHIGACFRSAFLCLDCELLSLRRFATCHGARILEFQELRDKRHASGPTTSHVSVGNLPLSHLPAP